VWIVPSLGDGASLRIEDKQKTFVVERLSRRLGPEAREPKQLCLRCLLNDRAGPGLVLRSTHGVAPRQRPDD